MLFHASVLWFLLCVFFFFFLLFVFFVQAEDGIRDLVRSRGLGDVYKRQPRPGTAAAKNMADDIPIEEKQRRFHELDSVAFKGKMKHSKSTH